MAPLFLFLTDIFTHKKDFTDTLQKIICSVVVVCGELQKSPEATHPFGGAEKDLCRFLHVGHECLSHL